MESSRKQIIAGGVLLLIITAACGISFDMGGKDDEQSEAEQTLQALYAQGTADALATQSAQDVPTVPEGFKEPEHKTKPGNVGKPAQTKDDIDTSKTADDKYALGDSFRLGNFERPLTETDMNYQPETDLIEISISKGSDFYYFDIEIYSGSEDEGFPSSTYGVEFDTDMDGRGDVLLWAKGVDTGDWTVENVSVLSDSNNDVGGNQPVVPDNGSGDGYDQVLFSNDKMDDPDAAWQRKEASDRIYLAVKTSLVGANRFMWKAWADSGVVDPAQFDYNDYYSESQAGSPIKNSVFYPLGKLNRLDCTCWVAYNFAATGHEPGGCIGQPAQPKPSEPEPPPDDGFEGDAEM